MWWKLAEESVAHECIAITKKLAKWKIKVFNLLSMSNKVIKI